MAQTATHFLFGRSTTKGNQHEVRELQQSLSRTSTQIHQAYHCFNNTCEDELIESYVYEINALHARYNYLLRRLKEMEG